MTHMQVSEKLYVITRNDLTPQYQTPQAMHAALDLAAKHTEEFLHWQKTSNTIVVLACKNEEELKKFAEKVISKGFQVVVFQEPDLENQVTSISIVPKEGVKKVCSGLPLAGKVKTRLEASYIP